MNNVLLVGRLAHDIETHEEDGKTVSNLILAVARNYKNEDGIYETDFIDCILYNAIATNTAEYCHKGDIVGIKGRLQKVNDVLTVVADKVTFLSSKHVDEDADNEEE